MAAPPKGWRRPTLKGGAPYEHPVARDYNVFDPATHPRYQQILAQLNSMGAMDLANSRAAIQQALIAFGMAPEGFQDRFGSLDAATLEAMRKNTEGGLSTVAQLQDLRKEAITSLVNNLSARGLRRSGAKGAGLRKRQKDYQKAYASSLQKMLQMANSVYGAYAQNEAERNARATEAWWNTYDQYGWEPQPRNSWNYWSGRSGGDEGRRNDPYGDGGSRNDPPWHGWVPQ
jgi:hypothetical protein